MNTDHDVLVLGAGPAGSALALQLAQAGYQVALADKKAFPRHKPCGEFFSPGCVPYLTALGLGDSLHELGACRVTGMRLSHGEQTAHGSFQQLPDRPAHGRTGFGVRRERFDHHLVLAAERAGATFLPRHEFVELLRDEHGRVCGAALRLADGQVCDHRARWVVGADGVHSRVAKALGVQRPLRWLQQMALVAHFQGVPALPQADVQLLRSGFFAATTVDAGLYSVNLVLPQSALHKPTATSWDAFVDSHLVTAPTLRARLLGGVRCTPWRGTGPFAFTTTAQTQPGVMLVGDAAGYVDPLTGEGIYFALFTAKVAADALHAAMQAPNAAAAAMARYCQNRHREIAPRLFAARLLQRGLRHPWLVRQVLTAMRRWPRLTDLLVTMAGDTIHPRDLLRPSFWRAFGATA